MFNIKSMINSTIISTASAYLLFAMAFLAFSFGGAILEESGSGGRLGCMDSLCAMDLVTTKADVKSEPRQLEGRIEVEAQDGGILLRTRLDELVPLSPDKILSKTSDARPYSFLTVSEIKERVLSELPDGFAVHQTANYLIFYDTSPAFAQWAGSLFERLHDIFYNFWEKKGVDLQKNDIPMIALLLSSKAQYRNLASDDLGAAVENVIGFYNMQTNKIVAYDLTGADSGAGRSRRGTNAAQISQILRQPEALRLVATIVHEATHQIAYNSGLQIRLADMPRWYSEGIAIYFETPDLQSKKGWSSIGKVNNVRLSRFRARFGRRNPEALKKLLTDDSLFNDPKTALDAYSEAWALTHFLIKKYPDKYAEFAKKLAQKSPFIWDNPEQRLLDFESVFGPWETIDKQLLQFFAR